MNAIGTNTESCTSVIAMMGAAVICVMAFLQASAGDTARFLSMTRSTFSTTTMAPSTTMPMAAHHRQQRHRVRRIAEYEQDGEGADQAHRNGNGRDHRGTEVAEEEVDHDHDQREGLARGSQHFQ